MKTAFFKNYNFYNIHPLKAAYIHVSDVCNFRCKLCDLPLKKKKSFVPSAEIKQKIKKAKELNLGNIIFTGQEILIHPEIDEIIKWSFKTAKVNYIAIMTNGLAFADGRIMKKLACCQKYMDKIYIGASINFYNAATFSDWSGHDKSVFKTWSSGFKKAINKGLVSHVDIILKRNANIPKILYYLNQLTKSQSKKINLRIADLLPLSSKQINAYNKLKYTLLETSKQIKQITKLHSGKIEFEAFPVCVFNQNDLKEEKYFIPSFYLVFENKIPVQYDSLVYEPYYLGPTENWLINKEELIDAYNKMFYYVDECQNCYYRNKCNGIQREYIKLHSVKSVNDEIKLLKLLNWK
ncbi:MAG: radical SAM protein [bacterium]|nr:radical SAM protein [bacterium]